MDEKTLKRFWAKVNKAGPVPTHRPALGSCWVWLAARSEFGYGLLWVGRRMERAHRLALQISGIDVPDTLWALHKCDNPACVRPSHLFLGTRSDNIKDMVSKGRSCSGERRSAAHRGKGHWHARLSEDDVRAIRELRAKGVTLKRIASQFGICVSYVSNIARRNHWKHVA